ncbi:MAG: hypothetical protein ACOCR0_01185 [Haloferacaceae archaeon]
MADTGYDRLADLPLRIDEVARSRRERDTSSGFRRVTTTFELHGGSAAGDGAFVGAGEDVTYETADHDALAEAPPSAFDLAGEYTFGEFSARLSDLELFPTKPPDEERFRHYRRWALESAGLDLALRQAGRSLGDVLGRSSDPVRFVVSTRLPDGRPDRVQELLSTHPDTEFKLDPTPEWDDGLVETLSATGAVRVLDLKGLYEGTEVDVDPDPVLYERVFAGFSDAVIEDPAMTDGTDAIVREHADRVSWDLPITGVHSIEALPFEPRWLNVKPSRFGTVESLLSTLSYCEREGIRLYGGGQFELGVGRSQIQALASLFYPDGPNDVAPGEYNDPDVDPDLPGSPLPGPDGSPGFGSM